MTRVACIDIGTVSCRLALADVAFGRVVRLLKSSVICNLGEGLVSTGLISDEACDRVVACVSEFVDKARAEGVTQACCTLTSAARDAHNADSLTSRLASLGLNPQVIPGDVEGMLTFTGVACDYEGVSILVADNGGGSTELVAGSCDVDGGGGAAYVESVDVGCRRVTERFLSSGGPDSPDQLMRARAFSYEQLAPAASRALASVPDIPLLVTCGGTVTSLIAMRDELVPYDSSRVHGAKITVDEIEMQLGRLAGLSVEERAAVPGLQAARAPVIVGGIVCVLELLHATGLAELRVSEHDLLHGLSLAAAAVADDDAHPAPWTPVMTSLVGCVG